jgi:hypothetical protein
MMLRFGPAVDEQYYVYPIHFLARKTKGRRPLAGNLSAVHPGLHVSLVSSVDGGSRARPARHTIGSFAPTNVTRWATRCCT